MKKKHFSVTLKLILIGILCFNLQATAQVTQTFSYTGSSQAFTVPICVNMVSVDIRGAQGSNAIDKLPSNGSGGLGGRTTGILTVTPGQVLYLFVGAAGYTNGVGGFNGGASGGTATAGSSCFGGPAGGGGGASDIRVGGLALSNRVAVAGGGGGAGRDYCNGSCQPCGCGGSGGCGGGVSGGSGYNGYNCGYGYPAPSEGGQSGGGGNATSGGGGGNGNTGGGSATGSSGTVGVLGQGGNGANGQFDVAGGGGGGGYFGGGGGGSANNGTGVGGAGGGGGSGYTGGLLSGTTVSCYQTGDGLIILSYGFNGGNLNLNASPPNVCIGGSATLTAGGMSTYTWSTGSNASSIVVTPTVTTTYTVSGTFSTCNGSSVVTVQVDNNPPSISLSAASLSVCPGQTVVLTAFGATSFTWSGGVSNGIPFAPSSGGTYTVSGSNGCGTGTAAASINVYPGATVTANLSSNTVCAGNPVTLAGNGATTYSWSGGVSNAVPFTPSASSVYTVNGFNANGCAASATVAVNVISFSGPVVSVAASNTSLCAGSSATIIASGVSGYTWSTGSNASQLMVSPSVTTVYSVQGTNSNGCISSSVISVNVNQSVPVLSLSASSVLVCSGQTAVLTASGASSYTWSGGIVNGNPFTPASNTVYVVQGANACGTSSASVNLSVAPNPVVTGIANSNTVCSGLSVTLTGSGANSYTWTGGVSNGVGFVPATSGAYSVTGFDANGCIGTDVVNVSVVNSPTMAPVASASLICIGGSVTLTTIGVSTCTWFPMNSNTNSIVVSPTSAAIYTVVQANGACVDTKTISVGVNFPPAITVNSNSNTLCAPSMATLTGSGASAYTWFPGSLQGSVVSVAPLATTIYTLVASDGTCSSVAHYTITVLPSPVISISGATTTVCSGSTLTLVAGGALSYTWQPGALTGSSIVVSPTASGAYSVTGVNSSGCLSQTFQPIQVSPNPIVTISGANGMICKGSAVTLVAGGAQSYTWSSGLTSPLITVNPSNTAVYSVTGTSSLTGCSGIATVTVPVFAPVIGISGSTAICSGQTTSLLASGANSYTWSNGFPFAGISVSPSVTTNYSVNGYCVFGPLTCLTSNTVQVQVNQNPTVTIVPVSISLCKNETFSLSAAGAMNYSWNTGSTSATIVLNASVTGNSSYSVVGSNSSGCTHSASILVKVNACTGLDEFDTGILRLTIYPNPNDGAFTIQSDVRVNLMLVNVLGQIIQLVDLNQKNEFKKEIYSLPEGVYFVTDLNNKSIRKKIVVSR